MHGRNEGSARALEDVDKGEASCRAHKHLGVRSCVEARGSADRGNAGRIRERADIARPHSLSIVLHLREAICRSLVHGKHVLCTTLALEKSTVSLRRSGVSVNVSGANAVAVEPTSSRSPPSLLHHRLRGARGSGCHEHEHTKNTLR